MSVLFASAILGGAHHAAAQFVVEPPIEISLGGQSEAAKVHDDGTIVGQIRVGSPERPRAIRDERARWHGFVKSADGPLINIDDFNVHSRPVASSRDGVVLANLGASNGQIYGSVFWTRTGGQQPVVLPERGRAIAVDMNDAGDAVFNAAGGGVYLWEKASARFTKLPCPTDSECEAHAMNAAGAVVGLIDLKEPVLWEPTTHAITKLSVGALALVIPQDINGHGTILGLASPDQTPQVVVWRAPAYNMEIVGDGAAYAINDHELIAGAQANDPASVWTNRTARLWDLKQKRAFDLPAPDGKVAQGTAVDVNNAGLVVGTIEVADGTRAVSWKPYHSRE